MTGCRHAPASYMAFDEVEYISSMKNSIKLPSGEVIEIDEIGMQDIFISDSQLFVSSPDAEGIISVYELPDLEFCGKFLHVGNGPGELLFTPFFAPAVVRETASGKNMLLEDYKGRFLSWDISSPFKSGRHDVEVHRDSLPLYAHIYQRFHFPVP